MVLERESDVNKSGDPYTELVLCIYPSQVHTHSSENTHHEHTPEVIYAAATGEKLGVRCPCSRWRVLYIHSTHRKTCVNFFFSPENLVVFHSIISIFLANLIFTVSESHNIYLYIEFVENIFSLRQRTMLFNMIH